MSQNTYDQVQYFSHPFRQSHPQHLSLIGELFGMDPQKVDNARILELGCAGGGNIIPIAAEFKQCEILGIDLSQKQIEFGKQEVDDLGLKNIKLEARSIMDIDAKDGKFDYIICHGIFSWVPKEVRDKIFEICRTNLSEQGIAYISYNTLPGWNMANTVRDMMVYHTKMFKTPEERVGQARGVLQFVSKALEKNQSPYSLFLKNEVELLSKQPDHYIMHEYLEEVNQAFYFHEFMKEANAQNLSYLSDALLASMFVGNMPEAFSKELAKVTDIVLSNQYMDFIRNQRFRSTLLCHENVKLNRSLNSESVQPYYFSYLGERLSDIKPEDMAQDLPMVFKCGGMNLTLKNRISKFIMVELMNNSPLSLSVDEIVQRVKSHCKDASEEEIRKHMYHDVNLVRLVLGGIVEMQRSPSNFTTIIDEKPKASSLARYQATKRNIVTNQRHQSVNISQIESQYLRMMDGNNTMGDMKKSILELIESGKIEIKDKQGKVLKDRDWLKEELSKFDAHLINGFTKNALFVR